MSTRSRLLVVLALIGGLAGCASEPAAAPATTTPTPDTAVASAATTDPGSPSGVVAPAADTNETNCGPIEAANGSQLTVFTRENAAGEFAGCTEAIDVLAEYFERAADESEGTLRLLTVQGWQCSLASTRDPDTTLVGCQQRDLAIEARS